MTGTPLYMSPEAIQTPELVDARSDLYAVGAIGYFLLTGQPVFNATSLVELCQQHMTAMPDVAQRAQRASRFRRNSKARCSPAWKKAEPNARKRRATSSRCSTAPPRPQPGRWKKPKRGGDSMSDGELRTTVRNRPPMAVLRIPRATRPSASGRRVPISIRRWLLIDERSCFHRCFHLAQPVSGCRCSTRRSSKRGAIAVAFGGVVRPAIWKLIAAARRPSGFCFPWKHRAAALAEVEVLQIG